MNDFKSGLDIERKTGFSTQIVQSSRCHTEGFMSSKQKLLQLKKKVFILTALCHQFQTLLSMALLQVSVIQSQPNSSTLQRIFLLKSQAK